MVPAGLGMRPGCREAEPTVHVLLLCPNRRRAVNPGTNSMCGLGDWTQRGRERQVVAAATSCNAGRAPLTHSLTPLDHSPTYIHFAHQLQGNVKMIYNCSNLGASIPKLNLEFIVKSTQISRTRPQNENKMKYILNPELCTLEMPFRIRLQTSKLNRWIHGLAVFICSRECSGTGGKWILTIFGSTYLYI